VATVVVKNNSKLQSVHKAGEAAGDHDISPQKKSKEDAVPNESPFKLDSSMQPVDMTPEEVWTGLNQPRPQLPPQ